MQTTASDNRNRSELATGFPILLIATLTAVLTGPGQTIGVSVFIDHFVDDLDLSRSAISTAYLVGTLTGSAAMPFVGRFIDRRGVRLSQVIIGALFGLALLYMSIVHGLVMLAIGFVGIRMLGQGSLSMTSTVTVQLRFVKQRGLALGVFTMLTGGLMAVVPVILNALIEAFDWRSAWRIAAVCIWCSVVPLGLLGLRSMPRGLAGTPATDPIEKQLHVGMTRDEAVRTRPFWIVGGIATVSSMLSTAFNFHQIDLLGDAGLTSLEAASMFLPQTIGSIVAGLVVGAAADRIGTRYIPIVPMVLLLGVHLMGFALERGPVVFAYSIALGAMGGATRAAVSTLLPAWFGTAHIGAIQGTMTLAIVAGSAIGPVALSLTEEAVGGYSLAFLVLAVFPLAALLLAATARPPVEAPQTQRQPSGGASGDGEQ